MPSGITISGSVVVVAAVVVVVEPIVVVVVGVGAIVALVVGATVDASLDACGDRSPSAGVAAVPGAPSSAHDVTNAAQRERPQTRSRRRHQLSYFDGNASPTGASSV